MARAIRQVRRLTGVEAFDAHCRALGCAFPLVDDPGAVLGRPLVAGPLRIGNRFCVLPMEGWDGTVEGRPTDLVARRWSRFGASGAKLVWGGEAVAVAPAGRANPRQLCMGTESTGDLRWLREVLIASHRATTGSDQGLVVGLQLTHSGRWARPHGKPAPRIAYRHPLLDERVGAGPEHVVTDGELDGLVDAFVAGARVAREAGFDFVDVKHCHGYLLHELLSAVDRPGPYGGSLAGRTRFLRRVVEGIRRDAPGLGVGVRLSAFDVVPHVANADGIGVPQHDGPHRFAFGGDGSGLGVDLSEVHQVCEQLVALGVPLLSVTAGSPYSSPHVQRPAYFPPSDGYLPPRDPLLEVARLVDVTGRLARAHPELTVVASGLSYLQEWLPSVAAGLVDAGVASMVGYGRGVLAYPSLPADVLAGREPARQQLCRTFSDCTTAPRHGLVSGCYPIDPFYKARPERIELARIKREARVAP